MLKFQAPKIIPEPIHLMHPPVQDRHDADIAIRQPPPVHEMMLVPEVASLRDFVLQVKSLIPLNERVRL